MKRSHTRSGRRLCSLHGRTVVESLGAPGDKVFSHSLAKLDRTIWRQRRQMDKEGRHSCSSILPSLWAVLWASVAVS